jgi:radical SAM protein with 4Fe4S-binding SPASM domain
VNRIRTGDLVDRLVTRERLDHDPRLERTTVVFPLCHDNLLSHATIPQTHYLIDWSKKAGVLYLHENIRGVTGCFDLTIEALNHLVEAGIPTIVVSAVCKENLHGVENIITLVQKLGVNTIKFNPVVPIGRGHHLEKNGDLLASREYIELFNTIKRAQKRVRIPVQMHFPLLACGASMLGNNMYYDCCVGNMLGLMSDGGLCLCGLAYTNKRAIYANIRSTKLKDIWCDNPPKIIRDLRGDLPNNLTGVCGKCMFKYICVGGCRAKALDRYGSVLGPNPICQKLFEEGLVPESRLIYN